MDTLQNMRIFMRVVDAGSFTLAAQQMELTTAHVSRAVADLERHLRTRLLNRTTCRKALRIWCWRRLVADCPASFCRAYCPRRLFLITVS